MATNIVSPQSSIPQRNSIDSKYKWDTSDIYESDDGWEEDYKRAKELINSAGRLVGSLSESPVKMYQALCARTELNIIIERLYQYSHLNKDLDNRVSNYQEMNERAAGLGAQGAAAFAFVEPELLEIDENRLLTMAAEIEKPDHYDLYIKELLRSKAHIRSKEVEEVLAQSSTVSRGPGSIFTMLDDADIKYPSIKDENGHTVQLTKQRYQSFMESADPRVRKDAHEGFYSAYQDHINSLSASLMSSVNADIFYTKARRYNNCLESALDGDNIPTEVYHSLIKSTENNLNAFHAYTTLRKRLLKLDQIRPYDMVCPLFPDQDYKVSYDEAVDHVLKSVVPLGSEYTKTLKSAFDNRWIDVYETEGKGSGAYSYTTYTVHPFVLMNYNCTVDNLFTLAHEMGHAMHSHLSNSSLPYPKARYSIFVAEVASTLNEGLLLHRMIQQSGDTRQRLYLLNRALDNSMGTFFHQVMYAHFEYEIHQHVEQGGALSPDMLNDLWKKLTIKYYGPEIVMDDQTPIKWSRIPHFYNAFYVYQYATSFAASQAILAKFINGEEGIIENYLKMLASGGSNYPIELLKVCGIDMTSPDPVLATLELFSNQVDEIEKLT